MSKVKTNNYMYQSKKEAEAPKANYFKVYALLAALVVVILGAVALVLVEKGMVNKLVVNNKSSHAITGLQLWYEDDNGPITEVMDVGAVASKEKKKTSTEELALSELQGEAWLSVYVTFEDGGEALLQTGQFLREFDGKIRFELADTKDEELTVRLKAGEGLFDSTAVTGCDDVYYINPKDGYIE